VGGERRSMDVQVFKQRWRRQHRCAKDGGASAELACGLGYMGKKQGRRGKKPTEMGG
jgi:hypothetical protein